MPPIFALVDFDPDGIAIMSTYKHGSWNLSHENSLLQVPAVRWLGSRSKDLLDQSHDYDSRGLLPLTSRDRRMATRILEKPLLRDIGGEDGWRRELQVMMMLGLKAEIEMLEEREGGITKWAEERLMEEVAALSL